MYLIPFQRCARVYCLPVVASPTQELDSSCVLIVVLSSAVSSLYAVSSFLPEKHTPGTKSTRTERNKLRLCRPNIFFAACGKTIREYDYSGHDTGNKKVGSADACRRECDSNSKCNAYTYVWGTCWMKNIKLGSKPQARKLAGAVTWRTCGTGVYW